MIRDSFVFYRSFYESMSGLDPDVRLAVFDAICEYSLNFNEIDLVGVPKALMTLIKPQLCANNKKFENGSKGAEYGKLGGRPKKEITPEKPQENPNKTPNVNVNDNVNDNVNVKKKTSDEKILEEFISKETIVTDTTVDIAKRFIAHRRLIKDPVKTDKAVKMFINAIRDIVKSGYNLEEVMNLVESREWKNIKLEWVQKELGVKMEWER